MPNALKTRVVVELQDNLRLFDSTDADVYSQLGVKLSREFNHYPVRVGSVLNFREMGGYFTGGHEVTYIETIAYPEVQNEHSQESFNLMIIYYVIRITG